jgi:hypothetical protein
MSVVARMRVLNSSVLFTALGTTTIAWITIVLWAVIISGAWWVGITVSAKNELTPQQRIDEAFEALNGGLAD